VAATIRTWPHLQFLYAASRLLLQNAYAYDSWMRLVQFAWKAVESKQLSIEKPVETEQNGKRIVLVVGVSLVLIVLFELFVWYGPVNWIRNHSHTFGIQASIVCLIPCLIAGILKPTWRKWCWGVAGISLLVGLLSLL
jgi:hypothetical protein